MDYFVWGGIRKKTGHERFPKEINSNLDKQRRWEKMEDMDLQENCNTRDFGSVYKKGREKEERGKKLSLCN